MRAPTLLALVLCFVCFACGQAPATASAAGEITIKGILLSSWNYYRHEMPANQSPKGSKDKFNLILYAFDGPPEVQKALTDTLARYYPQGAMNAQDATRLQEQFDQKLRYYIGIFRVVIEAD